MDSNLILAFLKRKLDDVDATEIIKTVKDMTQYNYTKSFTTTEGQQTFTITEGTFPEGKKIFVTASGVNQTNFTKLSPTSFQLAESMPAGETVTVIY